MIPKSLHTVTVLVAVATHLRTEERHIIPNTPVLPSSCYVDRAAELLGYRFDCDTYGLKARAASVMDKA